ncbi:alpha-1,3-galactosidase-related protein [Pontiella sulfatireligans]|nr:right-handed parallel beta-helix repeat-containing protein [Pontiella sulfatireligans]
MKRSLFILSVFWFVAGFAGAEVINVADHGIVPGKDVSLEANRLIESLIGKKDVTLYFPKGRYEFRPENALEKYRAVTNHDNSLKRMAFPIFGMEGLTLDGGGSTFVFHGRLCPITLEGSTGVTLKNFTIDWDTPFHHELKVVERDESNNSFVAEISPMKYGFDIKGSELWLGHYSWQDQLGQNIAYDPDTGAPYWQTKRYALKRKSHKAKKVGENRVELKDATKVAPPVGAVLCTYGNGPTNRLAQAIHIDRSKDTYIENVTVHTGGGMALIAERAENVHLNGFIVTAAEGRILATRADATHFLGCKGLIKLENCRLEHMADDGINVHGAYIKINEYKGSNTFLCAISHRQQMGLVFAEPGDRVMITSRETVLPIYETTVTDVKVLDEEQLLITVAEVPESLPKGLLSMENLTWYPDVVMKNNIIRNNRARSALISTKGKVLIEGNVFSSQMHGILIEGDNKSWYESGGVRDVTINNNTFENIGYGTGEGYPLYASPMLSDEQRLGDDQYHRNIRFTNNRLKSYNGLLAHAKSVKGLVLTGNIIELNKTYPTGSEQPAIDLDYCKDVTIEDNLFNGFIWPIRVEQKDSSNVKMKNNKGIE